MIAWPWQQTTRQADVPHMHIAALQAQLAEQHKRIADLQARLIDAEAQREALRDVVAYEKARAVAAARRLDDLIAACRRVLRLKALHAMYPAVGRQSYGGMLQAAVTNAKGGAA